MDYKIIRMVFLLAQSCDKKFIEMDDGEIRLYRNSDMLPHGAKEMDIQSYEPEQVG